VDLKFVAPDLRRLDELRAEALCLPFFEDERPFRGTSGLLDWRLRGQLSKLRIRGRIRGRPGEHVLLPGRPLTSFDKVFLIGLGPKSAFDDARGELACKEIVEILDACRARTAAIVLPGRALGLTSAERALECFLRASHGPHEQDEVTLVDEPDEHRAMQMLLERERRKARAAEG
jgi:hypothetical protein